MPGAPRAADRRAVHGRCTNPAGGHDYFGPFSCKGFYLCPSCSQKRTLLFAEHLTNEVFLDLPHRQFVFTRPKALRPFFRHDRRLFAEVSRLIYAIISESYAAEAGKPLLSEVIAAHQTFGDQLRCESGSSGLPELHSSRTKRCWSQMPHLAARAPDGWRASHAPEASAPEDPGFEPLDDGEEVTANARKRAWARLLAKVYEIDSMVCPKCGSQMKIIAVSQDPEDAVGAVRPPDGSTATISLPIVRLQQRAVEDGQIVAVPCPVLQRLARDIDRANLTAARDARGVL